MEILKIVALLVLWNPVVCSFKCGSPPVCKCFPALKVIECREVSRVPNFVSQQTRAVKILLVTGDKVKSFPRVATTWISIEKIILEETEIPCQEVILAAKTYEHIKILSKCLQATVESIVVTNYPNEEEEYTVTGNDITTNVNNIIFWLMMNASSTKPSPATSSVSSGWFDYGIVLTCLTVLAASIFITCCIVRRYRRQHGTITRRQTHRSVRGKIIIEEDMATIVESLGPTNDVNTSFESIELFSVPPKTSKLD